MSFLSKILGNASGPTPEEISAQNHSHLVEWGLSHVIIRGDSQILALGLGDGTDLEKLLALAFVGHVTRIDSSAVSVEHAKELSQWAISERRCSIVQGNAITLPFGAESFDLVAAFYPEFQRPDPEKSFGEVGRVLKRGGSFLLVSGTDGVGSFKTDELRKVFRSVDFGVVRIDEDSDLGRLTAVAVK